MIQYFQVKNEKQILLSIFLNDRIERSDLNGYVSKKKNQSRKEK